MTGDKGGSEPRDPEIEALLAAERERQRKRVVPLIGAGAAAAMGGAAMWWFGHQLEDVQSTSEVHFVLPDVVKIAGIFMLVAGGGLLAISVYITRKLSRGEEL
jgi:hypothetical protein